MKNARTWIKSLVGTVAALTLTAGIAHADHPFRQNGKLYMFDGERFSGQSVEISGGMNRLSPASFNDRAASIDFRGPGWLLCDDVNFEGACLVAREPIRDLDKFGLGDKISSVRPLSPSNPYPHGTIFGVDWDGDVVFYDVDLFGNLSQMSPYDAWGYGYGDGYQSGAYGDYGRYGQYNPYNPRYDYDPYDWTGYRGPRNADIVIYRDANFRGSAYGLKNDVWNLGDLYFNDHVSSIEVRRGTWEICTNSNFRGRCQVIDASVSRLSSLYFNDKISSIRRLGGNRHGKWKGNKNGHYNSNGNNHGHGGYNGQGGNNNGYHTNSAVTLYQHSNYSGRYVGVNGSIANLNTIGLNDNASSIRIKSGTWEICSHPNFGGNCQIINASQASLKGFRLNDKISSIRPVSQRKNQNNRNGYDAYKKTSVAPTIKGHKQQGIDYNAKLEAERKKQAKVNVNKTQTYNQNIRAQQKARELAREKELEKLKAQKQRLMNANTNTNTKPNTQQKKVVKAQTGKEAAFNLAKQKAQNNKPPAPKPVAKERPKQQKQKFNKIEQTAKKYRN